MAVAFVTSGINNASATSVIVTTDAATGAGNTIVVGVSIRTVTSTVSSITDNASPPNTYTKRVEKTKADNTVRSEIWSTGVGAAKSATTVTVTLTATSKFVAAAGSYSGVAALGLTATAEGFAGDPTITLTTQDANNWVVANFADQGVTLPTAKTGNLRKVQATAGGAGASNISGALNDNTAATASAVTNAITLPGSNGAVGALELRSVSGDISGDIYAPIYGPILQWWDQSRIY